MSFELVCEGCGAPSSPSVGICPFCKSVMTSGNGKERHDITTLTQLYLEGKLERALVLANDMHRAHPDLKKDAAFVLTFAKILIETEAPSSKVRGLLAEALLLEPTNTELIDYLELIEINNNLKNGFSDLGETALKNMIRRSPKNVHAHFSMGTHLFWRNHSPTQAVPHLETCVRLHPGFLRAWGCLGAIYKQMGHSQLAQMAFHRCATIETNQGMKDFFLAQARAS